MWVGVHGGCVHWAVCVCVCQRRSRLTCVPVSVWFGVSAWACACVRLRLRCVFVCVRVCGCVCFCRCGSGCLCGLLFTWMHACVGLCLVVRAACAGSCVSDGSRAVGGKPCGVSQGVSPASPTHRLLVRRGRQGGYTQIPETQTLNS